jgi:hypothetical protein
MKRIHYDLSGSPTFFDEQGQQISESAWMALKPPPAPDWPAVRVALLQDAAYNAAVEAAQNQRAVTRLEQYAMQSPDNWGQLTMLWNSAIASVPAPSQLTPEDCDRLNQLFQQGNLPINLDRDTALMTHA